MRLRSWYCQTCGTDLEDQDDAYAAVVVCQKCGTQYYNGQILPESAIRFQTKEIEAGNSRNAIYRALLWLQLLLTAVLGPALIVANILAPRDLFVYGIIFAFTLGLILELGKKRNDISLGFSLFYWLVAIVYLVMLIITR